MKKILFILISTLLIVSVLAVPCLATNEGLYGHYISPGRYIFNEDLVVSGSSRSIEFDFYVDGVLYYGVASYPDVGEVFFEVRLPVTGDADLQLVYSSDTGWIDDTFRIIEVNDLTFYNSTDYQWWLTNLTRYDAGYDSSVLDEFLSAFTFVGQWISGAASDLTLMFWTGSELTFVGILTVSALAFAVSFMIIGLISRFLRFRG